MVKDVAGVFLLCAWHEGLHAGQVSVARRSLGQPPVMQGPPASPSRQGLETRSLVIEFLAPSFKAGPSKSSRIPR